MGLDSERLTELLKEVAIPKTTFHCLRNFHASFLFGQDIDIAFFLPFLNIASPNLLIGYVYLT